MKDCLVLVKAVALLLSVVHGKELYFLAKNNTLKTELHYLQDNLIIKPGMGYSTDIESPSTTTCYNVLSVDKNHQESVLRFDQSIGYDSLTNLFEFSAKAGGGYGNFSANAEATYFNSIKDESYSLSINYYQKVDHTISMTYSMDPDSVLSDIGKKIYNDGKNPMFRLFCGDYLISSYKEGARLIFTFIVRFKNSEDKNKFASSIGGGFGGFINASTSITSVAEKVNVNGKVILTAFQSGGDPSELSKVLSSSVLNCDIRNLSSCEETAKKLIDYASNLFPTQLKKDSKGVWDSPFVPFGIIKKGFKVSDFGLVLHDSFVTKEVDSARKDLIYRMNKISYYYNALINMQNTYIGLKLDLNPIINKLKRNLDELQQGTETFKYPNRAIEIYNEIIEKLDQNIEDEIYEFIIELKYAATYFIKDFYTYFVVVYPVGNGKFSTTILAGINASDIVVKSLGELSFSLHVSMVKFPIKIKANLVGESYIGTITRVTGEEPIIGTRFLNTYIFPRYGEKELKW